MSINISFCVGTEDHKIFSNVINQGIDSRLEGFTKSEFSQDGNRIHCDFHEDEISILLRRLGELELPESDLWERDIVEAEYGKEIYE